MSIFISYRRSVSKHLARLIFQELRARGHDVFLDVSTIDSGTFDRIILNQIAARPHFLLILSPGALERCANEDDWLRREIEEAFRLKRNIVPIFDEGFNIEQEKQFLPEPIRSELPRLNAPPYSHYYFDAFIETICNRFLRQPGYDVPLVPTPATEHAEVQRRIDHALNENEGTSSLPAKPTSKRPTSLDILPIPFTWITIPAGTVALGTCNTGGYLSKAKTFDVPAFAVTKYPLTNAQFAKFVEAGGYNQSRWWTVDGWQEKEHNKWVEPRLWQNTKWNQANHPVVGVSWYEAQAFCLWLGEITGEQIMLPTEQQWQRAAQGDTGNAYPWGNKFDKTRCNFGSEGTTPVTQYEGKGNSSFGLVDMSGNVLEWCLTDYENGSQDMSGSTMYRVLRGGSWSDGIASYLRADFRLRGTVAHAYNNRGFRLARSQ